MKEEKADSLTLSLTYTEAPITMRVRETIIGCSGASGLSTDFIRVLFPLVSYDWQWEIIYCLVSEQQVVRNNAGLQSLSICQYISPIPDKI